MPEASVTRAITPSRASISLTRWPLPKPPMAGLQDISPMDSNLCVKSRVFAPIRADAAAASQPAWPPPITMTSQFWGISTPYVSRETCFSNHLNYIALAITPIETHVDSAVKVKIWP